jgi:hypothetical protein
MPQLEHIEAIEKRLWSAANNLRANSKGSIVPWCNAMLWPPTTKTADQANGLFTILADRPAEPAHRQLFH